MEVKCESKELAKGVTYNSILDLIGNTPLIKIEKLTRGLKNVEIYAKAEWYNPGGSVKDRAALSMIEEGERSGHLTKDKIILDSTSGNTGVAYALIGNVKGYKVELVIPANVGKEKRTMMLAYGAKIIFSDPLLGSDGAQVLANEIFNKEPEKYFMPCQYNNPANVLAHYKTTGLEILEQTNGKITHFITGVGTSGTLMGTRKRLKEFDEKIQIFSIEPEESLHGIEGLKHMATSIVPKIYDESLLDGRIFVKTDDAFNMTHLLAQEEGILVGYSSGAALKGALELAEKIKEGVIVTIFPDSGERYLDLNNN
ncbi:MAG TPA: cysteine synthase family protein [Nitrospinota bacterium]|nr:cysteine synthase family protein [Nitrospinota bacterium]